MTQTSNLKWQIRGIEVGCYHDGSMLQKYPGLEDVEVIKNQMVRQLYADVVDDKGIAIGNLFCFKSVILATKHVEEHKITCWLKDRTRLNAKIAPSLLYIDVGKKVQEQGVDCLIFDFSCFCEAVC